MKHHISVVRLIDLQETGVDIERRIMLYQRIYRVYVVLRIIVNKVILNLFGEVYIK
jgi:hypothetical protein